MRTSVLQRFNRLQELSFKTRILLVTSVLVPLTLGFQSAEDPMCSPRQGHARVEGIRYEGLTHLLELLDAIVERNPEWESTMKSLRSLDPRQRQATLHEFRRKNEQDTIIAWKIEALVRSEPYQIYFRMFRNVTPEIFRQVFCALPFEVIESPGDIAGANYELLLNKELVKSWIHSTLDKIDLSRCFDSALRWCPDTARSLPEVFVIYDGNAGSFATEGKAFFNLQQYISAALREPDKRGALDSLDLHRMEATIAHEIHHVLVETHMFPSNRVFKGWQHRWIDRIVRGIVSEGSANHCTPPEGFQKQMWNDRTVLRSLVEDLNNALLAIRQGTMNEDSTRTWYEHTFQEIPRLIMQEYLTAHYPSDKAREYLLKYISIRPDLIHALGWWMVSTVSEKGKKPENIVRLIRNPFSIFEAYNASLTTDLRDLRIDDRVIRFLSAVAEGS
jgi:hypothetical protein